MFRRPFLFLSLLLTPLLGLLLFAAGQESRDLPAFWAAALSFGALLVLGSTWSRQRQALTTLACAEYEEKVNLLESQMSQDWQLIEANCKKILSYSQLKELTEKLCASFSLSETTLGLSAEVGKIFGEKDVTVILYLFNAQTGELGISASRKGETRVSIKEKRGDAYDQWVVKTLRPLLVEDTKTDFRFDLDKIRTERAAAVRSLMVVPLMIGTEAVGIIRVDHPEPGVFSTDDIRLLSTVAEVGAVAIENAQLYEKIEDMAVHDSLTGLFLRRYLLERLAQEISRHLRLNQPLCFLMLDLDGFKSYNDRYGHPAGDIVLKTVGQILEKSFSVAGTFVCRYGGEEFAVILPCCPKDKGLEVAEALRQKIAGEVILLRRQETRVTVSIGVASFPEDAQIKEELIAQADAFLYKAKLAGRNQVCGA